MRAFTFLSTLLLSTALALPALAGTAPLVSPWQTGMMKTQDGKFAYCMTQGEYAGGTKIIVALTAAGDINLGVEQQGGKFPVGGEKPVKVAVDNLPPFMFTARAVKPTMMVINAGRDPALLDAMAKGSTFKIDGQGFELKGSGKAVATLRECVAVSSAGPDMAQVEPPKVAAPAPAPATAPVEVAAPGRRSPIELPPSLRAAEEAKAAAAKPAEVVEAKPVVAEAPKPVVEAPKPVVEAPKPVIEAPKPVIEAPKAVVEAPKPVVAEVAKPVEVAVAKTEVVAPAPVVAEAAPAAPEAAKPAPVAPAPAPSLAPELIPPAAAVVAAPAPAAVLTPSVVMQTLPNGVKPLPAPLLKLLGDAKIPDVKPVQPASGQAFAWQSRDMKGSVTEQRVEANSPITLLAARYSNTHKDSCADHFALKLGQEKSIRALKVLTGNIVCHSKGQSIYMTQVYTLSETGVFTVINHSIDRGRRASPDKAQAGVLAALAAH